jgi:hypothetical protein
MPNNQNCKISWAIVCAMMMELGVATATALSDFKISIHKRPLSAAGAFPTPAFSNRGKQFSVTLG